MKIHDAENKYLREYFFVVLAVTIGAYLRLANLGVAPFWCDEAFFATRVTQLNTQQEFLPGAIAHILGTKNEFVTRLPFAIAGIITILMIYITRPSKWSAYASLLFAVFPVFVMHDRMCRPYAMAGMFLVIAWRWRWSAILMLLCTPVSIVGIDWIRAWKQKISTVIILCFGLIMFALRTDLSRPGFFTLEMFLGAPRLWYLPMLVTILFVANYGMPWLEKKYDIFRPYQLAMVGLSVFFLTQSSEIPSYTKGPVHPWYSNILFYNDWRGMPPVDFSTNFIQISEYYTGKGSILLRRTSELTNDRVALTDEPKIYSMIKSRDTILIGADSYAMNLSSWFFPDEFLSRYGDYLWKGGVLLVRMRRIPSGNHIMEILDKPRSPDHE